MRGGLFYFMVIKHTLRINKIHSEFPCGHESLGFTLLNPCFIHYKVIGNYRVIIFKINFRS
jgi:membrane-associated PAP2 superfamily phosphatase